MGIVRKTKSVNQVLSAFQNAEMALSVVDLVDRLKEHMNKTTVYRILDRLESDGVLHYFYGKDGLKWYAKCSGCNSDKHEDHHPHLQCTDCGCVERIPVQISIPELPNVQGKLCTNHAHGNLFKMQFLKTTSKL